MRFLGLGLSDPVLAANTIWTVREALTRAQIEGQPVSGEAGTFYRLFARHQSANTFVSAWSARTVLSANAPCASRAYASSRSAIVSSGTGNGASTLATRAVSVLVLGAMAAPYRERPQLSTIGEIIGGNRAAARWQEEQAE
jgi:hypothetical protein